jgi:glycosyltransferase involved in cell wall biosynthesis
MVRILVFAYACEPEEGSEPGAGWAWSRMLAHLGETWVITRSNNREAIEAGLHAIPERKALHFVYVDLPSWARFWKRGRRGIHLYYVLWQLAALRTARRLHARNRFHLTWHLTLANAWLGSAAPLVGPRFVYGPIGGGVTAPLGLLPSLGPRGAVFEVLRSTGRGMGRFTNPLARVAWRRAGLILVQNEETREWLPRKYRVKAEVFPNIVLDRPSPAPRLESLPKRLLFAGQLTPLKGGALAIRSMTALPGWGLDVYGSGPDEGRLRRLARRLGVDDRVNFHGTVSRSTLLEVMSERAHVFLSLTLHEEGGWAVAEALSSGLPVLCLDRGGPPLLGGHPLQARTPDALAREVAAVLGGEHLEPPPGPHFDQASRLEELTAVLDSHGLLPPIQEAAPLSEGSNQRGSLLGIRGDTP